MAPRKCRQGRRPAPFCLPSRPYSEWPSAQLLEECARRGIRVIRKGPGFNASKDRLALTLRQSDVERAAAAAVTVTVTGEQLLECGHPISAVVINELELQRSTQMGGAAATHDDDAGGIPTIDDGDEAATEQESQEPDEEHETALDCEGASTRGELSKHEADQDRELNEEQQQQQRAEYNATFRLVNVLFSRFASRFDELMRGTIEDTDRIAKRRLWIDVCDSFYSSAPEFSTLINDHAMFADIDPSLPQQQQRIQSRRAIVRAWKSLSATYSRALQQARQVGTDDAQFYAICGGRLDVLYLHLWLLLKPQLAIYFASELPDQTHSNNERGSHERPVRRTRRRPPTTTERPSPLNQAQAINSSKSTLKRKRVEKNSGSSLSMQQTPTSKLPDAQADPALYAEYMKLKLEVLREKKALLATSAAREQMQFLEEQRRGLLRDVSALSIAVDDLQQRLAVQSIVTATSQSDEDQSASPTAHTRITRQQTTTAGTESGAAVAELKQDLAFFRRQKRQRVADVARCDQQIQEFGVRLFGGEWIDFVG